jgi:hypothetical protein
MKLILVLLGVILICLAVAGVAFGVTNIPGDPGGINEIQAIPIDSTHYVKWQDIALMGAGAIAILIGLMR